MDSLFHVDGKPFFSIGGQLNNSTSSDPALTEKAFKTCVGLGLNTVAAPVHWELFEKEEGAYDFAQIDMLMELARRSGLRLVVLWFGTWKNGNSHYVPEWVKLQKERFLWAKANDGAEIRALSPTCEETKKADMRAFCELCGHIARNNADGCVIGIQIENEPGLIGAARDYSPQSTKLFKGRIPADAAEFIGADGTWEETFGFYAAEFFTAYHIAHYIDDIAEAGKRVLDLPMYINVWLGEMYAHIPGTNYPSGGAVTKTFRFWKHLLKHVDAIAPDIYVSDYREVEVLRGGKHFPSAGILSNAAFHDKLNACRRGIRIDRRSHLWDRYPLRRRGQGCALHNGGLRRGGREKVCAPARDSRFLYHTQALKAPYRKVSGYGQTVCSRAV